MKQKVIFVVGPTAVGKSKVGISLAKKIKAEIISCDSMQVYKGMEIISSQPSLSERKEVPHHLIGIIPASKDYNVSVYRKKAVLCIKEIIGRGNVPLFVGGTGLYMSVVIDGIFNKKAEDLELRQRLYAQALKSGNEVLYARLKEVDPSAASKIHLNDLKRIIRALEVFVVTGKPISQLQKKRKGLFDQFDVCIFCLNMERSLLYEKIEERVEKMFQEGIVDEVKKLLKKKLGRTAQCAIGVRELKGYFNGEYSLDEAKRRITRNTCLYSKRQLTWFRKDKRICWIEIGKNQSPDRISQEIYKKFLA